MIINRHPSLTWIAGPGGIAIDMEKPGELTNTLRDLLCLAGMCSTGRAVWGREKPFLGVVRLLSGGAVVKAMRRIATPLRRGPCVLRADCC